MALQELILLKNGEIALKGLNRSSFEEVLIRNARRRLKPLGSFEITKAQSTIYVRPLSEDIDLDMAVEQLSRVFGFVALHRACLAEKNYADISQKAREYLAEILSGVHTFKVEAKRSDKQFSMTSPEICRELGGDLLEAFPHLRVDVNHPDVVVTVEVRDFAAFIHAGRIPGAGGIPTGTGGRAAVLLSGGIDSPVAAHMMAKRGLELIGVHFVSPPYTSERAKLKVVELTQRLCQYCGRFDLYVVPFTKIQEQIRDRCPEELFTIIMRRYMMRIAQKIAAQQNCGALITGESLGQVASQTIQAIGCTDQICTIPVFRPLIGMDKEEIIQIARKIDTFETSIQPYEDCCTVFTPKHPKTHPRLEAVLHAEEAMEPDVQEMICQALEHLEHIVMHFDSPHVM